jgi:hypothetical protein
MAEKSKKAPEQRYQIHNMTRSRETRAGRAAVARERSRTVLMLGGGSIRVMRNRPLPVTETTIRKLHAELVNRVEVGAAKVTTDKGEPVDIRTLKALSKGTKLVEGPKPKPKPDTVADDKPAGNKMPKMEGGVPQGVELPVPAVGEQAIPEGEPPPPPEEEPAPPEEKSFTGSKRSRRKKG